MGNQDKALLNLHNSQCQRTSNLYPAVFESSSLLMCYKRQWKSILIFVVGRENEAGQTEAGGTRSPQTDGHHKETEGRGEEGTRGTQKQVRMKYLGDQGLNIE